MGDPGVSYANAEFTDDGRYMVWFEMDPNGRGTGTVWHRGVNPGALIPPDGKGFRAFESAARGRANSGLDAQGPYYVSLNRAGCLALVRPTGPASGRVAVLSTPPDPARRAVYPTRLPDRHGGYVYRIENENVRAGGMNPRNPGRSG